MSINVIELARSNDVHLLCLPAHTTHILQPPDVGVFKSFKSNFSKAGSKYLADHPGRVITTDKLAFLVAEAWPNWLTAINIMSGFKKCGIYPINPGVVTDRDVAPSKALRYQSPEKTDSEELSSSTDIALFSPEKEALYQRRYEEHYDLADPGNLGSIIRIQKLVVHPPSHRLRNQLEKDVILLWVSACRRWHQLENNLV